MREPAAHLPEDIFPGAGGATGGLINLPACELLGRDEFTRVAPHRERMRPMGKIRLATIHHTGFPEGWRETDRGRTAQHLEAIRTFHTGKDVGQRGWADIGYHFAVDRAGRLWQLRPLAFEGAHVKNHNGNNAAIVLLGNFDIQRPAPQQIRSLAIFLDFLRLIYSLNPESFRTHREIADEPTACPGRELQRWMDRQRAGNPDHFRREV